MKKVHPSECTFSVNLYIVPLMKGQQVEIVTHPMAQTSRWVIGSRPI